tara:strand:- start:167 stop:295 length:129 start_codon:yes stop_codon:yes gene_type:complete
MAKKPNYGSYKHIKKPKIKRPGRHSKRLNKNSKRKKRRGSGR